MTFDEMIRRQKAKINQINTTRNAHSSELRQYAGAETENAERIGFLRAEEARMAAEVAEATDFLRAIEREAEADDALTRAADEQHPTGLTHTPRGGHDASSIEEARIGEWINADTGERAALRSDESIRSHPTFASMQRRGDEAIIGQYGSFGKMLRALTTTSGSAIVPTLFAGDFIDRVRNQARVMQAGASVIPMPAKTINIGRLTGDPTAAFRAEGSSITQSDPTFDNVTLTAKTLSASTKVTMEWMQDAENGDDLLVEALAAAMAQRLDLAALYGGIISGAGTINLPVAENPRGVLATLNAVLAGNVLGGATNGTALTSTAVYNEIIDTIFKVRDGNEEPTAAIWNTKLARQFAKAYDTTGQPIRMPQAVEELNRLVSNQIPSYTQGTMTNVATDVFIGDWDKLLIGERLSLQVNVNTDLYAETGHVGIFVHWRGDIAPARPAAFAVYRALGGAA